MLLRATFSNLYSFDAAQTVSFVAGKTAAHITHVVKGASRYEPNVLKSAIIYGANASGKSNLIKCFDFARTFILKGLQVDEPINRVPFRLRKNAGNESSSFEFEMKIKEKIYSYRLVFTSEVILEESLTLIGATTERNIFFRSSNADGTKINSNDTFKSPEDKQFFDFLAKGTRPNQPFLTETVVRNSRRFRHIYDWFKEYIVIVYPGSIFGNLERIVLPNQKMNDVYKEFFKDLDLGIAGIAEREIDPLGGDEGVPPEIINEAKKNLTGSIQVNLVAPKGNRYRIVRDAEGGTHVYKLMVTHSTSDGSEPVQFELRDESDGTMRLIDLIPGLVEMCENEKLYLIDEIDRSMHAHLTRAFLEYFYSCSTSKSQLLATTHELDLLDLKLLRKDEIWFVEKDHSSVSHVYSLEEFKPRYDKDIRKGYLQGRFGAIPVVRNIGKRAW